MIATSTPSPGRSSTFRAYAHALAVFFLASLPLFALAQTVQLGSGTSASSSLPVHNTSAYSLSQTIYTAQELTDAGASAGYITKIRYKATRDMPTTTWRDWVVYMNHTDKEGFRFQDKVGFVGAMKKVFDGRIGSEVKAGQWLEIILDEPFQWNGSDNIVILVDQNTADRSPTLGSWQSYDVTPAAGFWRGGHYANNFINPDPARPMDMQRSNNIPQIQFQFEPLCTGTPEAGTVPAVITNCSPFVLVSTGAAEHAGIKGQWESAPAGTNSWSPVAGAINARSLLEVPPKTATDYRYRVTCTATGLSAASDIIQTTMQPADDCYCIPTNNGFYAPGAIPYFYTSGALQNVSTIEEKDTKDRYTDYTDHTIAQLAGDSVVFQTLIGKGWKLSIWVDWNQDGDFTDEGELVFFDGLPNGGTITASFKVPENALPGRTRMRVGIVWSSQFAYPCPQYNETAAREDYSFEVVPRTACTGKPDAGTVADHFNIPRARAFTLATKGQSAGVGYGLVGQWQYRNVGESDWFSIEGATGTAHHVEVSPVKETYYRYILTCVASGLSDTSNTATFTSAEPQYADVVIPPNNPASFQIKHFSTSGGVQNISHAGAGGPGGDNTNMVAAQKPGHVISFTGYTSRHRGTFVIYVDWNQDGDFNSEAYGVKDVDIEGDSMYRGSFPVPHFAKPGQTRMRLIFKNNNTFVGGILARDYTFEVLESNCSDVTFPATANALSATSKLYGSGDISLNLSTQLPLATGLNYQWQSSTDGQTWSDIGPPQSGAGKKVTNVTETTRYRAQVYCGGTLQFTSDPVLITVEQVKEIVSTVEGERCTPGSVTLEAYGEAGSVVNWYDSPTSSIPIFTGNVFETPMLSKSKTYYASVVMSSSDIISKKNVGDGNFTSNAIKKERTSGSNPIDYYGHTPFKTHWASKYQYIITADELAAAGIKPGNIHSVAFEVTSETGVILPNYTIAVGHTDRMEFVGGRLEGDLTTVYVGDVKLHVGENTFPFNVPFEWDGTSNLVVSLCNREQANGHPASGSDVKYDYTDGRVTAEGSHGFWSPVDCEVTQIYGSSGMFVRPVMIFEATAPAEGPRVAVRANLDKADAYATANSGQSKNQTYNVVHEYVNEDCEKLADILSTNNLGMVDVQVYMGEMPATADGIPFVGRYFTITPTQNFNAPSVITLYFSEAEILAYNAYVQGLNDPRFGIIDLQNPQSIRVYGYHGNMSVGGAGPNGFDTSGVMIFSPTEVIVKDGNVAITFTTLGFSGFYINGVLAAPLAISMGDISVRNHGRVNVLSWDTHAEEEGDWFEVERSVEGNAFEVIERLPAKGRSSHYQYTDEHPAPGYNYYRLALLHHDGSRKTYTKVVMAKVGEVQLHLEAYPNPATEKLTVRINGVIRANAVIQIVDISGKVIRVLPVAHADLPVSLSGLRPGVYLLKYKDDTQEATIKIVKK